MALCPFARQNLITTDKAGRAHTPVRVTLHTAWPGPASGPLYPGRRAANGTYAHFYIDSAGVLYQSRDTAWAARADGEGNYGAISVETWDGGKEQELNAAQAATFKRLWAWCLATHATIPDQLATTSDLRGLAWHRLGVTGNFGAYTITNPTTWSSAQTGVHWSTARGKLCPGGPKILQLQRLYKETHATPKTATYKTIKEDYKMATTHIIFETGGAICVANIISGTWERMPNAQTFRDRCSVLKRAGATITEWKALSNGKTNRVENPNAFGVEVIA